MAERSKNFAVHFPAEMHNFGGLTILARKKIPHGVRWLRSDSSGLKPEFGCIIVHECVELARADY